MFVTKSLLELDDDECDNLNFMNFKIVKFEFSIYACHNAVFHHIAILMGKK